MKKAVLFATLGVATCISALSFVGCQGCSLYTHEKYDDAKRYEAGNFKYAATSVSNVEIDWVEGAIEIVQTDGAELSVSELEPASNDDEKLHWYLDGSTLKIKYCKSGKWGYISEQYKSLHVEIPSGVDLEVESVSANITLGEMTLNEVSLENISGKITANALRAREVTAETVSGEINLSLESETELEAESTSGNIYVEFAARSSGEINCTSGNINISFPEELGARVSFGSVSGTLRTSLFYRQESENYVFGDGGCVFEVNTTSGNCSVSHKIKQNP